MVNNNETIVTGCFNMGPGFLKKLNFLIASHAKADKLSVKMVWRACWGSSHINIYGVQN